MEDAADMHARHAATLAELSALGLELARKVQASAMATDDPKAEAALTGAFHKLSRSVRQTMALEAKLRREIRPPAPAPRPPRPKTREDRIRDEVSRLIWDEYEDDEDEAYDLEDQLDDILDQDLPDIDESDIVQQIAEHLGLRSSPLGEGGDKRRLALGEPDAIDNDLSIAARNARALGAGSEAVEGVEAHQPLSPEPAIPESPAPQPPQSASADSSPGGEHLEPEPLPPVVYSTTGYPIANLRRPPLGLPGEYPPWEEQEWQDSA